MSDNQSENSIDWAKISHPAPDYPLHDVKLADIVDGKPLRIPEITVLTSPPMREDYRVTGGRRETDPNGTDAHAPGAKLDAGKLQPWLFFSGFAHALEKVAEVTTIGANKYTPNGWVTVPEGPRRYMEAYQRHALKLGQGQVYDTDPGGIGTKHLAQMIWNLLAVLELEERNAKNSK